MLTPWLFRFWIVLIIGADRPDQSSGSIFRIIMGIKYVVDPQVKRLCQLESQRQGRNVLAILNSVDRLPGDANTLAEISLTPATFGAKHAKPVLHLNRNGRMQEATP
jgi:hypothetical protein